MRERFLVLLLTAALGACETRLHVGEDGTGGHAGAVTGAAESPLGTGGLGGAIIGATGGAAAGSAGGSSIVTGTGGAAGQAGAGGAPVAPTTLSVNPGSATFTSTLVEAVSAPQTFTVHNDGNLAATTTTALTALAGTNAADFQITSNACGATLQPGESCDVAIAFAPKTRSGQRTANLSVGASSNPAATVALTGTALPSLGLLAGKLGGAGTIDGTGATARFTGPNGMIGDGAGNLYVADGGHIIRKI